MRSSQGALAMQQRPCANTLPEDAHSWAASWEDACRAGVGTQTRHSARWMYHGNIPHCRICPNRKKVASGTNECIHTSALKQTNRCCWDEKETSRVIVKLQKNLEFCEFPSNQSNRDCSFLLWCPRPLTAALSKVTQNRERGRTVTPECTKQLHMYIGIIRQTVVEKSGYYGLKSLILNLLYSRS